MAACAAISSRGCEAHLRVRIVEPRENVSLVNVAAFFGVDGRHARGDFGSYGCSASRRDVSARI